MTTLDKNTTNSDVLYLNSLGIDVGTTTSHIIFSKLKLEKVYSTRGVKYEVTEREIIYKGNIMLTPINIETQQIDYFKLVEYLKEEYNKAGINIDDIDTGAAIITGESAKKKNAEELVTALAHKAGKFVAASAGPRYESIISAMGSSATTYSKKENKVVMNIDIGGGTSNVAIVSKGEIIEAGCVNVGGRLLAFDENNRIIRIEQPIRFLEERIGINFDYGMIITDEQKREIAQILAASLYEVIINNIQTSESKNLMMTGHLSFTNDVEEYSFSGGVAEYIYKKTDVYYNDLGKYLGEELIKIIEEKNLRLYEPDNLIRATVIGAGAYSLQVSGVTTHISNPEDTLPIHSIPVINPKLDGREITEDKVRDAILSSLQIFDKEEGEDIVALLFKGPIGGSYAGLTKFVKGVASALPRSIAKEKPIILVFDHDIGNSVGNVMIRETEAKKNIISIDEIAVEEGEFIDIDKPKIGGLVVPVVVKSLVFSD